MAQWNRNTVPKCDERTCSNEVLVTVEKNRCDGRRIGKVVRAVYIPYHHCTVEDMCWDMPCGVPDDWEYVEEEDTWWIPQGWYEVCDYFDDYSYATITDNVAAWMRMPNSYDKKLHEIGGAE